MSNNIPYIVTDESITVVVKGKPYTISKSNTTFLEVKKRISNNDFAGIEQLFNPAVAVASFTKGNVTVQNGSVLYKGKSVHNHVVDRILEFIRQGLPYQPLINFLDKLLENPSARAVAELYTFLEHKNMPLTADGNFWAYKGVRENFYSVHAGSLTLLKGSTDNADGTGHINNTVGQEVECPRNQVSDNTNDGCAQGLHIGSLEYAKGWGARMVIVEVNPADVVCVPVDSNCQKMRCCHYKVINSFERPLTEQLVGEISVEKSVSQEVSSNETDVESAIQKGFDCGVEDAEFVIARDAEAAYEEEDDGSLDEAAYIEAYHRGYDLTVNSEQAYIKPANVGPVKKTVSESTRQKLREAALRQQRDSSGKYV